MDDQNYPIPEDQLPFEEEQEGYYEEDEYEDEYEEEKAAGRRAGVGCLVAFLVVLAILGGIALFAFNWYKAEVGGGHATATGEVVSVTINRGNTTRTIGAKLEEAGLIGNSTVFRFYVKLVADDIADFKYGDFELEPGLGYDDIIELLSVEPDADNTVDLTIRDGVTIMSVANLFEEAGIFSAEAFFQVADNYDYSDLEFYRRLMENPPENVFHLSEGLVYPDTYNFDKDESVESVVRRLYEAMDAKFTAEMYARMDELGLSMRELLSFASVVQAESGFEDQNPAVAGVFWNRLNNAAVWPHMDSDVTLRYVKQWMQWNLEEYEEKTFQDIGYVEAREVVGEDLYYAYVTTAYFDAGAREGLPEGPICSVDVSAINAVLWPEEHNYFLFVTDNYNNYYYATTNEEHNANVRTAEAMNQQKAAEDAAAEDEAGE